MENTLFAYTGLPFRAQTMHSTGFMSGYQSTH